VSSPFFTVAIPTKDRPDRVKNAVRSVLEQTFTDFEVVVCDNSDEADAGRTAAAVDCFGDPRVRYVRTSGRLSMPDNWERAIEGTRGEYVGILTDRSVFRGDALEVVRREIEATGAQLVTWFNDQYGKGPTGKEFKRRECTLERYRHNSKQLLDYFLHGNPKYSIKVIPKLMTSFCHAPILEAIRDSAVGRCCPPVAPDFTSGFLMLGHCEWVLTLDECLYVSCGAGNGSAFRRGGELAAPFIAESVTAAAQGRECDASLAAYERARRAEFSGKWKVERLVGAAVGFPSLINRAANVLSRRRDMADLFVGVVGDFVPAREVLKPMYLLNLMFSPASRG